MIVSALGRMGQQVGLMTIRERAKVLGVSYGHLAECERGGCVPSPELQDRMAKAYERPLEHIERAAKLDREGYARRITEHARDLI